MQQYATVSTRGILYRAPPLSPTNSPCPLPPPCARPTPVRGGPASAFYPPSFRDRGMIPLDLSGKVALVTGVGDDMGFAWSIAKALQAAGARLLFSVHPRL